MRTRLIAFVVTALGMTVAVAVNKSDPNLKKESRDRTEGRVATPSTAAQKPERAIATTQKDTRMIVKEVAREHMKEIAKTTNSTVTSTDRTGSLSSPAHDRGAIDVVNRNTSTPNQFRDAEKMSKELGDKYVVIVEQAGRGHGGKDRHTVYYDGQPVKATVTRAKATGDHIHLQPQYEIKPPADLKNTHIKDRPLD